MKTVHAIYRFSPDEDVTWSSYSYPESIYVGGQNLPDLDEKFIEAAKFHYDGEPITIVRHLELPLTDGVYVRIARDSEEKHRRWIFNTLNDGLVYEGQRVQLQKMYRSATGYVVIVACVAKDRLSWVLEQIDDADTLLIAAAATEFGVWWIPFAGPSSDGAAMAGEPVLNNKTSLESTIADLMQQHHPSEQPLTV